MGIPPIYLWFLNLTPLRWECDSKKMTRLQILRYAKRVLLRQKYEGPLS
jgi:hypothetical protein